jgi:RNA-directed DNA polymerase
VNTGAPWPSLDEARAWVLGIQTKLHRWATEDSSRRFDDLFNLVTDPAFLLMAWHRVRSNKGARTAGVDGWTARYISVVRGEKSFLAELRADLKGRRFVPPPVRERMIPKAGGRLRRLGIPTVRDRVVQAALKLVLEPIWEADFRPCSYGFRPNRRAHDAIAEIHLLITNSYEWVLDADIEACFDTIDHRPDGPAAAADRRQARARPGQGVSQGRRTHRRGRRPGDDHRHTPGRDPDSSNAVGSFCFETALTCCRGERPRRVTVEA